MAAFSEINGVPATADRDLLTDLLRGEMKFRGFVFSDYTADEELIAHGYAEDERDAARLAILAGVDMSMQRSEEHTSELQSLMRISYAAFCLKKKKNNNT